MHTHFCGRQETKGVLYIRTLHNFKCHLAAVSLLHYYPARVHLEADYFDMHNAKHVAIFVCNKELRWLNLMMHYIHVPMNYLQCGLSHTLDTLA